MASTLQPPSSEALSQLCSSFDEKFALLNQLLSLRAHSGEIGEEGFLQLAKSVEQMESQVKSVKSSIKAEEEALGRFSFLLNVRFIIVALPCLCL